MILILYAHSHVGWWQFELIPTGVLHVRKACKSSASNILRHERSHGGTRKQLVVKMCEKTSSCASACRVCGVDVTLNYGHIVCPLYITYIYIFMYGIKSYFRRCVRLRVPTTAVRSVSAFNSIRMRSFGAKQTGGLGGRLNGVRGVTIRSHMMCIQYMRAQCASVDSHWDVMRFSDRHRAFNFYLFSERFRAQGSSLRRVLVTAPDDEFNRSV